jgi:ABC-2 type transport system permease protein/lipopolysaccharide transport system permease protein
MLPLLMQMGMFATPVAYGLDQITKDWLVPYVAANPLAAVIDGYRHTLLYGQMPDWKLTGVAAASATLMLLVGYKIFKKLETGIADVA